MILDPVLDFAVSLYTSSFSSLFFGLVGPFWLGMILAVLDFAVSSYASSFLPPFFGLVQCCANVDTKLAPYVRHALTVCSDCQVLLLSLDCIAVRRMSNVAG